MLQILRARLGLASLLVLSFFATVVQAGDDPDAALEEILQSLRKVDRATGDAFEKRVEELKQLAVKRRTGHVVIGQIQVEGKTLPVDVASQVHMFPDGYFLDAIRKPGESIGFRAHGYEPVDVTPEGPGPIEDLGIIRMKPLSADRTGSAEGSVMIKKLPGAPKLDQVDIRWTILGFPTNSLTRPGAYPRSPARTSLKSKVAADGSFSITGMVPAKYRLTVKAPNCLTQVLDVDFAEKETTKVEPILIEMNQTMNVEFAVAPECDFAKAQVEKTKFVPDLKWRASDDVPEFASDLQIRQKDGKLYMMSAYSPSRCVDLGKAELNEKRNVEAAEVPDSVPWLGDDGQLLQLPIEDGHVYLIRQSHWKHWILFRATFADK